MSDAVTTTTIRVMDREFAIKCPQEQVAELQKAAKYLDNKMQEIHRSNKFVSIDKVAIVAALNIANDSLSNKHHYLAINTRITNLTHKIISALTEH